ncbi:MAG: histidine triad nucleotide-binding protein [Candidatus Sungbacteria bacterium]|nr:histidine triad nucleotide-binding protein [Candidatus Sungbacteria bacterium]
MPDCLFCKITKKELGSDVVFEDADLMVFKDVHPKAPVHVLIVPKEHIQSIADLEENHSAVLAHMLYTAKKVAKETYQLAGYKLIFNVGRDGGQVIDHLHLHLLGGWSKGEDPNQVIPNV